MESVAAAGGYLIQVMPGCEAETIAAIEQAISKAPPVTEIIRGGADAREMLQTALDGIAFDPLETHAVEFRCKCSYERAVYLVAALGEEEVSDMLAKDNGAELTCHFCNEIYSLDEAALRRILEPSLQ